MGQTLTLADVRTRLKARHGTAIRLDAYFGMSVKTTFTCRQHGPFEATPGNVILVGSGCPACWAARRLLVGRKTHEAYCDDVLRKHGTRVVPLQRYTTAMTKIMHVCDRGHRWPSRPNDILSGYGCPFCDTSTYRRKTYIIRGRSYTLQGREIYALRELIAEHGASAVVPCDDIYFTYREAGRTRRYLPDLRVGNLIVEVKSPTSMGLYNAALLANLKRKRRAVLNLGYEFELRVYDGRGERVVIPDNWPTLRPAQLHRDLKGVLL